jgi:hypothetical protein
MQEALSRGVAGGVQKAFDSDRFVSFVSPRQARKVLCGNMDHGNSGEKLRYLTVPIDLIDPQIAGGVTIGIAISNEVTTVGEITVKNATIVSIEGKSSDAHLMMGGVEVKNVTVKLTSAESFHARDLESRGPNSPSTMPRVLHQH